MIYEKNYEVTSDRADRFCRLKPSAILAMLQDAAGEQCRELGLDWETLARKNLFWAVTRNHVLIHRLPLIGETIRVLTWPVTATRSAYPRALEAYDSQGQLLFQAMSLWVLMDMEKRSMVLPGRSGVDVPGLTRGTELAIPGSIAPCAATGQQERTVVYSELDRNGHMSNIRYLDWVMDLRGSDFHRDHPLAEFTVAYLSEAREGQTVSLGYAWEGEQMLVEAVRPEDGDSASHRRVFAVRARFA